MYGLCSYPPALFDSSLLLREASCGFFLDLMFKPMSQVKTVDMSWTGGALIQRIPWSRGSTYRCIVVSQYTEYVTHKNIYVVVVFDGYGSTNTKDMTHQRRSKGNAGTTVTFTGDTAPLMLP